MSLATIKREIIELCPEEQERLADILAALIASRDSKFVEKQSEILNSTKEWISLEDVEKDLN